MIAEHTHDLLLGRYACISTKHICGPLHTCMQLLELIFTLPLLLCSNWISPEITALRVKVVQQQDSLKQVVLSSPRLFLHNFFAAMCVLMANLLFIALTTLTCGDVLHFPRSRKCVHGCLRSTNLTWTSCSPLPWPSRRTTRSTGHCSSRSPSTLPCYCSSLPLYQQSNISHHLFFFVDHASLLSPLPFSQAQTIWQCFG